MAETPMRFIRIDEELWAKVKQRADAEGVTRAEVIRRMLDEYVNETPTDELRQITRRLKNLEKRLSQ